VQLMTI